MSGLHEIEPLLLELYELERIERVYAGRAQNVRRKIQRMMIESGEQTHAFIQDLRKDGEHGAAAYLERILTMPMGEPAAVIH